MRLRLARAEGGQAKVHRLNSANRATDQALALMASAPDKREPALRLLLHSIRTEPSFVNAYAGLAAWHRLAGDDPFSNLMHTWTEHGGRDQHALAFIEQFRDDDPPVRLAELCRRRNYGPSLIVQVADDLGFIDLYDYDAVDGQLPALIGRVNSPRLVCSPRDFGGLPAAKQVIAEDAVKRGKDCRVVHHRGTTVQVSQRKVFGPAIDSLYYNASLHETVFRSAVAQRAHRVAEIGVGSGFLLTSALGALPSRPLKLLGSDIDASAVEAARRNMRFALADATAPEQVDARVEDNQHLLEQLPTRGIDLLLTNPPYIPERRFTGDNPYSGTRVIESFVAAHAERVLAPGGVAVVLFSSLASAAMADSLTRTPLVPVQLARPRRVPFDLREVGSDARWIELLESEYGLEFTLSDPSHAYWHTLHVIALCRPEDTETVAELRGLAAANGA